MNKIFVYLKEKRKDLDTYFANSAEEIRIENTKTLKKLSIVACLTIIVFSCITSLLLDGWGPCEYHYMFMAAMVIYVAISFYISKHIINSKLEKGLCVVFLITLMIFLTILDTIPSSGSSQIFVSLFLVTSPIMFIVNYGEMFVMQTLCLTFFLSMTFTYKTLYMAEKDMLATILSYFMGFVVYSVVVNVRIDEYGRKYAYKISSEKDPLTGINNRLACKKMIERALERKISAASCALLIIDLDNFKSINDTLGHGYGDKVLVDVADTLSGLFRKDDIVGRFGGDEFIIFVDGFNDDEFIKRKCIEISEKMKMVMDGRFNISCSIGVCLLKSGNATLDNIFKLADDALYATKSLRKGRYTIHIYNKRVSNDMRPMMVVVDDVLVDREILAAQFEEEFIVEKFEDGTSALRFIHDNANEISIVLLDRMLPDINGMDILKKLKGNDHTTHIPIIIVSSDEYTEEEALKCGANDMITKPVVPAIVRLRVKNVIKRMI